MCSWLICLFLLSSNDLVFEWQRTQAGFNSFQFPFWRFAERSSSIFRSEQQFWNLLKFGEIPINLSLKEIVGNTFYYFYFSFLNSSFVFSTYSNENNSNCGFTMYNIFETFKQKSEKQLWSIESMIIDFFCIYESEKWKKKYFRKWNLKKIVKVKNKKIVHVSDVLSKAVEIDTIYTLANDKKSKHEKQILFSLLQFFSIVWNILLHV